MCAIETGALRVMQLLPESLECTETCETPDALEYMDYMAQSQDTLGDASSGSPANFWGPDQSYYAARRNEGTLKLGAGGESFMCPRSILDAAKTQHHQQLMRSTSSAACQPQQESSGLHYCSTYLDSTQAATGITPFQRASVVDNMVSAAASLGLDNDSLFLAVALLDRYLAARPTEQQLLQPTAIACLRIAGKYEGGTVPPAACFSQLMLTPRTPAASDAEDADVSCCCEDCSGNVSSAMHFEMAEASASESASCSRCSAQQQQQQAGDLDGEPAGCSERAVQLLNKLEMTVLQMLDYRIAFIPTVATSKRDIMQSLFTCADPAALLARQYSQQLYCCVSYLCEVSALEYSLLPLLPQQTAAAAFAVAHMLLGLPLDDALLTQLTGYCTAELIEPMQVLVALHGSVWQALHLGHPYAVTRKYCGDDVFAVGCGVPPILSSEDPRVTMVEHKIKPDEQQQWRARTG